jgi:hypothetical protein
MHRKALAVALLVLALSGKAHAQFQIAHDIGISWGTADGLTLNLVKKYFIITESEAKAIEGTPLYFGTGINACGFVLAEIGIGDAGIYFGWNFDKGEGTIGLSLGVLRFPKISCE